MADWAAIIIGIAVAVVAFLQWQTAHERVVLDLFDRRMKVYDEVNEAIVHFLTQHGNMVGFKTRNRLSEAGQAARFLFGPEVTEHIEGLIRVQSEAARALRRLESETVSDKDRANLQVKMEELDAAISGWKEPFTDVCLPYLKMDQKRVNTPAEWWHRRNELRKSFGREQYSKARR